MRPIPHRKPPIQAISGVSVGRFRVLRAEVRFGQQPRGFPSLRKFTYGAAGAETERTMNPQDFGFDPNNLEPGRFDALKQIWEWLRDTLSFIADIDGVILLRKRNKGERKMIKPFWKRVRKDISWGLLGAPDEAYLIIDVGDEGSLQRTGWSGIPFARVIDDHRTYKIETDNWLTPEDRRLERSFRDHSFPTIEEAKKALQDVFCTLDFSKLETGSVT